MKCQILFSRKNKKDITNLPSAESAHSMVSVKLIRRFDQTRIEIIPLSSVLLNLSMGESELTDYHNHPKYSGRQALANSVRVYTVYRSSSNFKK